MNAKFVACTATLSATLFLFTACPLLAQRTPSQRLTDAFALEMKGKPGPAATELQELLNSGSLDALGSGKAWNVLGLAYEDMGEFALSQRAYEESLRILKDLPDNIRDYAMALDDFGGLYVATAQFEAADKLRTKALGIYEQLADHAGIARALCDLATLAFSQNKAAAGNKYLARAVREAKVANDLDDDDRAAITSLQGWQAQLDGDFQMSVARYRQALDLWRGRHGEEHSFTGWGHLLLGDAQFEAGQLMTGLAEIKQGLAILGRTVGRQNPHYLLAELAYSRVLDATGSHAEAVRVKATAESLLKDAYRNQCAGCTISAAAFH
jgi:tetratricopeptide (TPR) repeat protein